jgi:Nif-specific regulatory protein
VVRIIKGLTNMTNLDMLQCFLNMGKEIIAESDINRVLTITFDNAMAITKAERGLIALYNKDDEILFQTLRNLASGDLEQPEFEVSQRVINKVKSEKRTIYLHNALKVQKMQKHCSTSTAESEILSIICSPLRNRGELFGVIYLDKQAIQHSFTHETYRLVEKLADFISSVAYRALERKKLLNRITAIENGHHDSFQFDTIVGHHPKMAQILKMVVQVANTEATILIQGESGTGKELIAHALYQHSGRKDKIFVPINCGALPGNLLESELFGHVKGSFTGALKDKAGWFERAEGGTIFLDEVSEMSAELQVKLLRILQTGEYSRVGSTEIHYCNVRIIAATNQDLQQLIREGTFREDLYYRLNVIKVELPPLRERKSDIPLLANHFLTRYSNKYGKNGLYISRDAELCLLAYEFPGNVRELENIIQHAVILANSKSIDSHHLPIGNNNIEKTNSGFQAPPSTFKVAKQRLIEKFERDYIVDCLKASKGNISRAAGIAGIHFTSFYTKMVKYGIAPYVFKQS